MTGLFLLMGFVVYVSVFTAEIGSKLRPSSSLQPPLFTYTYGYSFQLVVTGFLAVEVAGTSAVFLFIYWHRNRIAKKEMHRKMAMALVQTPIDLSQASHILPLNSQLNTSYSRMAENHHPHPHIQQYYPVASGEYVEHYGRQRSLSFDSEIRCNGGKVVGCSSSANDDDSCIPTPPPSVFQSLECPIHRPISRPQASLDRYVTVHNPAVLDSYMPPYATLGRKSHDSNGGGMPDITNALTHRRLPHYRHHQQRQMSSESDSYKQDRSLALSDRLLSSGSNYSQEVCLQCHGAGHVTVGGRPHQSTASPSLFLSHSGPMSRDLTTNTVCTTVDMESPSVQLDSPSLAPRSRLATHYGSLRRMTAV